MPRAILQLYALFNDVLAKATVNGNVEPQVAWGVTDVLDLRATVLRRRLSALLE